MKDIKTILFTGATGFLGSSILKSIVKKYDKIIILKRSFSNTFRITECLNDIVSYNLDEVNIEKVFAENKIDMIVHCATDYGRKNLNRLQIIEANLILPVKLLDLGVEHGVSYFINTDTILDKRVNHYSLSKKQFKDWLFSYKNKIVCINVALEHFFGSGDDKTKFVSYIVNNFIDNVATIDLTKGEQKRDFIYIEDVVDAFVRIIQHAQTLENNFYEFQIGSQEVVSIKDFVLMIKRLVGNQKTVLNFGAIPYRENEVMDCSVDVSEIKKLGWQCRCSLEQGLEKMIRQELIITNKKI